MLVLLACWQRATSGVDWGTVIVAAVLAALAAAQIDNLKLLEPARVDPAPYIAVAFDPQFAGGTAVVQPPSGAVALPPSGPVDPRPGPSVWVG